MAFVSLNKPVKVSLYIPRSTAGFVVMDENFVSRGFGLTTTSEAGNRQALWSIRKTSGRHDLYYQAVVRQLGAESPAIKPAQPKVEESELEGPELTAAEGLIEEIRAHSADTDSLVAELFKRLNNKKPDEHVATLLGIEPTPFKHVQAAQKVLTQAGIISRAVTGIRLTTLSRNVPLIHWLEVYDGQKWIGFDPLSGERNIPGDYLPWYRGNDELAEIRGAERLKVSLSVTQNQEDSIIPAIVLGKFASPLLYDFSLFSLPLETQAVYRILLMVPLGALIVIIFRNIIGLKSFGTFMPVLIALAFRETQLVWGIVFFTLIIALGLGIRFYLDSLKLLLAPRLGAVLTIVVLMMALVSVITHKLGIEPGLSVALFPMVILTMTIERMSIVWEERGATEALTQGLGSLFVAAVIHLTISISYVEHLIFIFPELLLVVLAIILMLGRYTGYRLLELGRFKSLAKGA